MYYEDPCVWFHIASKFVPPQHVEYSRLHNCHDRVSWFSFASCNSFTCDTLVCSRLYWRCCKSKELMWSRWEPSVCCVLCVYFRPFQVSSQHDIVNIWIKVNLFVKLNIYDGNTQLNLSLHYSISKKQGFCLLVSLVLIHNS